MIVFGVKKYFYQQYSRLAEKENVIYKKIVTVQRLAGHEKTDGVD